jgi:hypothetical protein
MSTIVLREVKGSALTFAEGDANFTNLNTDKLELTDISVTTGAASGDGALSYNNTTGVFTFNPADTGDLVGLTDFSVITGAASGDGALAYNNLTGVFTFNPADTAGLAALDDFSVTTTTASGGGTLSYNNVTGVFTFAPAVPGIASVSADTTPALGGNLDCGGNVVIEPQLEGYRETVYTAGATTGIITPDPQNGNVQKITLTGNITFNAFGGTPTAGDSMTLIIGQSITGGETLTSTMMFAGGNKTLSVDADAIDILTVFYDGTDYYASLANDFI